MITSVEKARLDFEPMYIDCVVCGSVALPTSMPGAGDSSRMLFHCERCGLSLFDAGHVPQDLYEKAYEGDVAAASMQEFSLRARFLTVLQNTGLLTPPVTRKSLRWLEMYAEPGSTVLDVGCGWGIMLKELKARGFRAVGTDLAPKVKETLEPQGFPIHVGTVDQYPDTMPEPDYVTCNFVLHHPEDPVAFLRSIAERFPDATLLLTEGLYPNWMSQLGGMGAILPTAQPEYPRQLTSWSVRALSQAFEKAGYGRRKIYASKPSPGDIQLPLTSWVARLVSRLRKPAQRGREGVAALETTSEESTGKSGQLQRLTVPALIAAIRAVRLVKAVVYSGPAAYARMRRLTPAAALAVGIPDREG
ncbi:MAG: class I SAM-dependent methyltransferase [Chloroflexota bacterium]